MKLVPKLLVIQPVHDVMIQSGKARLLGGEAFPLPLPPSPLSPSPSQVMYFVCNL